MRPVLIRAEAIEGPSPASPALRREIAAAAREDAAINRRAEGTVAVLAPTSGKRAALSALHTNEARLVRLGSRRSSEPIASVFELSDAGGGCSSSQQAIGG